MRQLLACLLSLLVMGWVMPAWAEVDLALVEENTLLWQESAHALNGVNCSSCHQESDTQRFVSQPNQESCRTCHEQAVETFLLGKHGIRLREGESPLRPAMARLSMQSEAQALQMTCNTCHDVHSVNTTPAAVDSCLGCHRDPHSLNYENSRHAELFMATRQLPRPGSSAVSCATCHLPRHQVSLTEGLVTQVNHNNTYTLKPRDRMVQEVCMNCHGVEFSYNSIFDDELVIANFDHPPTQSLQTLEMMQALEERRTGSRRE